MAPDRAPSRNDTTERWGSVDDHEIERVTIRNRSGLLLRATNYGATITEMHTPDRDGNVHDIVLGFDDAAAYHHSTDYFGCVIGRCANRIANAAGAVDGLEIALQPNAPPHHLHGGDLGFHKQIWKSTPLRTHDATGIRYNLTSPDGDHGYPGTLHAQTTYLLSDSNELTIRFQATTDRPTLCNLAQHTYWNLAGHDSGSIRNHLLRLHASRFTPTDDQLIPIGEIQSTRSTPLDFSDPRPIAEGIDGSGGLDHNMVVDRSAAGISLIAELVDPRSGRTLSLHADQDGVQVYSANHLDGSTVGKHGTRYGKHAGLCLETQAMPDAVNQPGWRAPILRPGEVYRHEMRVFFGVA